MMTKSSATALLLSTGLLLAGCAGSSSIPVQTASVDPNAPKVAAAAKPDPACVALLAKIDGIRKEGVTERAEQAAQGKSTTVPVKRASLAQLAELSKANSDYQAKCSAPGLKSAYVAPVMAPVAAAPVAEEKPAKKAAAKPAAKPVAAVTAPAAAPVAAAAPAAVVAAPVPAPVVSVPVTQVAPVAAQAAAAVAPAAASAVTGNLGAAAVDAAKKVATQAATSAVAGTAPLPSIPGVSVAP